MEASFIVDSKLRELFDSYKGKIEIISIDKRKYKYNIFYRIFLLKSLFNKGFSEIHNLSFTRISIDDEISLIAGLKGKTFAFENNHKLKRIFNNRIDKQYSEIISNNGKTDFEKIVRTLKKIGIKSVIDKTIVFSNFRQQYSINKDYYIVAPYSSMKTKSWDINKYHLLVQKLAKEFNFSAVILHSEFKNDFVSVKDNIINLTGQTKLRDVISLMKKAKFFVGNDSGLFHVAKALRKEVFGIVGGGVWGRIYPYLSEDNSNYFYFKTECFNCDWQCKFESANCLQNVSVDEVYEAIRRFLLKNA